MMLSAPASILRRWALLSGMMRSAKKRAVDQLVLVEVGVAGAVGERGGARLGHAQPHQAEADDAHQGHVGIGRGAGIVGVGEAVLHQPQGRGLEVAEGALERAGERRELRRRPSPRRLPRRPA